MSTENLTLVFSESWLFQAKNFTGDGLISLTQPEKASYYLNSLVLSVLKKNITKQNRNFLSITKSIPNISLFIHSLTRLCEKT